MSALGVTSEIAGICGGLVLPSVGLLVYFARNWVKEQIVIKLSNDDTPVAKYAHDARDAAREARDTAQQALTAVNQTNQILIDHVTSNALHPVDQRTNKMLVDHIFDEEAHHAPE